MNSNPEIAYPEATRDDVMEEHFGHRIVDPYCWVEKNARSNREVADWVAEQNAATQDYLTTLPGRDAFRERFAAMLDCEQFRTAPRYQAVK